MRAARMLIRAQIKSKKGSYISIFILTLMIGLMLSFSLSLVVNIRSAALEAVEASKFGDLYLNYYYERVPEEEDFRRLEKMQEIERVVLLKKIKVIGKPANLLQRDGKESEVSFLPAIYAYNKEQLPLRLLSEDQSSYVPSEQLAPPKRGEVYLPILFITMYEAEVGDRYVLETEGERLEYEVAGFVEDITQVNMVSIGEHNLYLNPDDFQDLEKKCADGEAGAKSVLTYTVHADVAAGYRDVESEELFQRIEDQTGLRSQTAFYGDDELFVYFASLISYLVLIVILIFVIVLFIAGLAILNFNIYSSIESEYKNIGVMKAVGLKNFAFHAVYLLSYPTAIVLGLIVGSLISIPLLGLTAPLLLDLTGILGRTHLAPGPVAGVCLVLVAICLLLILWQLRGIKKIKPYRVLSEGKQAVYGSAGLKIKLTKPLFFARLSFKQFTSSVRTYFGSAFVIGILFFFLLTGFSLSSLMTPDLVMKEYWGFDWDLMILYKDEAEYKDLHEEVNKIVLEEAEVNDSYLVYQHMINGLDQNISTFSLDETHIDRLTSLIEGEVPRNADEVVITKILADSKKIEIGDEIELNFEDEKATYTVSGYFQTINNVGRCVVLTNAGSERLLGESYDDDLTQVWYVLDDQAVSDAVKEKINDQYPDLDIASIIETWEGYGLMSGGFKILPVIIFAFAVVFIVISSFLLAEKIFHREQIDFGILKAIGFKNKVTRQIFSLRFAFVAFSGVILGLVLFSLVANPLLNGLAGLMGLSQVKINIPALQVMLSALALVFIFWTIAHFTSRKIKRLKVRDLVADV